jgi:hypothetical protein
VLRPAIRIEGRYSDHCQEQCQLDMAVANFFIGSRARRVLTSATVSIDETGIATCPASADIHPGA